MRTTQNGEIITELTLQNRHTITGNKRHVVVRAQGVYFKNLGTNDVKVDLVGTIKAGATEFYAVSNESNILVLDMTITFSGAGTSNLEIVEMISTDPAFSNYEKQ